MKATFIKATMLSAVVGLSTQVMAQTSESTPRFGQQHFRTWSVGLHAGLLNQNTLFNGKTREYKTGFDELGYGAYIKKQILPSLGIQADFLRGKVSGHRIGSTLNASGDQTFIDGYQYDTQIQWSGALSAVYNIANISINKQNGVLTPYVKAGAGYMRSDASVTTPTQSTNAGDRDDWFIPVGAGFKLAVSKGINLDFGYDVNFVKTSKFNGLNGTQNDRFAYAHGGLEFALGSKEDPQLQNYSTLANLKYQSKEEAEELRRALSTAEQNALRDREQYAKDMADDDNDGVANKFDKCPGTPSGTVVDGAGCPIKVQREIVKETKVVVTEADRKIVADAISNLEFDFGKASIREKSYTTLNRVATLLMEKNFSLKLAGHTDNVGSDNANMKLSKDRAEAIKAYLVSQGANASRIEAVGYGETQPIATNGTAAGRQANRRVEFTLY